ncbi:hypothetical protein FA95DRAFT_1605397 [Auriscalpium vulgare]|uniref:Uncharacterized protein n=1 Tax=Auriscalpium vulgare TaxID=40419 RepID=A0ACB8RVQ5_9AGAM|nr:hypothetical protein FA95DRAFT_1605397 [Auriscalpium vulgare]
MSLSRAALQGVRPLPILARSQRRLASTSAHDEHHHDEHHDSAQYPKEGFTSAGWRYTILGALGVVAFYKWAPSQGDDNFVTRYIEHYYTPKEAWEALNNKHLELSTQVQETVHLVQDARRPPIIRYRHPQSFEKASPYNIPVGQEVDLSGLKVKGDKDF